MRISKARSLSITFAPSFYKPAVSECRSKTRFTASAPAWTDFTSSRISRTLSRMAVSTAQMAS
jgi:hypothetical protein